MTTSDLQELRDPPGDHIDGETARSEAPSDLANILRNITILIAEADRRQEEALRELHAKLETLGHEARSVRANVPDEYMPAFEQIEDGLSEIANQIVRSETERRTARQHEPGEPHPLAEEHTTRLAGADAPEPATNDAPAAYPAASEEPPAPLRSVLGPTASLRGTLRPTGVDPFDIVDSTRPGNPDEPWDGDAAEALTRVYESLADGRLDRQHRSDDTEPATDLHHLADPLEQAVPPQPSHLDATAPVQQGGSHHGPVFDIGRDWLEARFAEIATRVEQSLMELRAEQPASSLDTRFEQFENRFGQVMESVATRSDLENLRDFETHLDDLAQHVEQAQLQLQRLDTIEAQLNTVMEKLSDQRLSQILEQNAAPAPQLDAERIARQAAEQVAQRLTAITPSEKAGEEDTRRLDELRDLLSSFMQERRHGEEQTASMLDTMQQAMIRLLDRVDALEFSTQPEPAPHPSHAAHPAHASDYAPHGASYELPDEMPGSQRLQQPPGSDLEARKEPELEVPKPAPKPEPQSIDPVLKADGPGEPASAGEEKQAKLAEVTREQLIAEARRAMAAAAAKREAGAQVEAEKGGKAKAGKSGKSDAASALGGFSKSTRRIMVGACTLLLLSSAVLMLMPRKGAAPATGSPAQVKAADKPADSAAKAVNAAGPAAAGTTETRLPAAPKAPEAGGSAGQSAPQSSAQTPAAPSVAPAKPSASSALPPAFLPQSIPETGVDELSAPAGSPRDRLGAQEANGERAVFPGITMARAPVLPPQDAAVSHDRRQAAEASPRPVSAQAAGQGRIVTAALSNAEAQSGARSTPAEMPPVMIGPLSLRQAAAKGDPSAEFEVAARFAEGKGVPQDFQQAMRWYQRSASQGFGPSQYRLGTLYERGLGTKADNARARIWYQRAAEQGHIKAMHNLAVLSASREGSSPDYATAARWFSAAAERGLADSQYNLAVLHEGGLGVPRDLQQAYKWFAVAAKSGDKEALRRLDGLRARMSASEILTAEQRVTDFEVKPIDRVVNDALTAGEAWKSRAQASEQG